ncbi:hypothetical protein [Rahnella victoriana]|uniref:Uncharacterized protein n=1 Tax=Rahnella victoriana TaxID=1510570 RepID=A0ABS0DPB2_9GAMM|nr:hypothetical protein [Rahnella victoriana]MBF7954414.1 hypothetical protein [Rahnella victoriana]
MVKKFAPNGSDVSAGTYSCADCGHEYSNQSKTSLPPCPNSLKKDEKGQMITPYTKNGWNIESGKGDAKDDPYPNK